MFRPGATDDNLFPKERKGCLDVGILKKLGCTKERVQGADALFFVQLFAPICNTEKGHSKIDGDKRMCFFPKVCQYSNLYQTTVLSDQVMGIGHKIKPWTIEKCVHWWAVPGVDGVRGGSKGNMERRWDHNCVDYDEFIANAFSHEEWVQGKWSMKLCDNRDAVTDKNDERYDPAYKIDMMPKILVHNTNFLTKRGSQNITVDESSYGTSNYGPANLIGRIMNKPGVTKGGQVVIATDVERFYVRAYLHRHKARKAPDRYQYKYMGPVEIHYLLNQLDELNIDRKKHNNDHLCIYNDKQRVCLTMDNYFSGPDTPGEIGKRGYAGKSRFAFNRDGSLFYRNVTLRYRNVTLRYRNVTLRYRGGSLFYRNVTLR